MWTPSQSIFSEPYFGDVIRANIARAPLDDSTSAATASAAASDAAASSPQHAAVAL
jgi:hypothetical protein